MTPCWARSPNVRGDTAQVVIRWHIDDEVVVIPKSASPERIASNFDVFGFALDDAELHQIDDLSGEVA